MRGQQWLRSSWHVDLGNDNVSNKLNVDLTKMYNNVNVLDEKVHVHTTDDIDDMDDLNVKNENLHVMVLMILMI